MSDQVIQKRRPGRPRTGRALKLNINVMLDPKVAEQLRAYGEGNLSAGVSRVVEAVRAKTRSRRPQPLPAAHAARESDNAQPRPVGRPTLGDRPRKRTNVQMHEELREALDIYGAGSVSEGIERAGVLAGAVKL